MKRQVIMNIAPDGTVTIDAVGYKGADCKKATEALEKALGNVTSDTKKPEYMQTATVAAAQKAGQR